MDCCTFDSLLTGIGALSGLQCTRLLTALTARVAQASVADIIQVAMASKLACPRCQGRRLYRHGEAMHSPKASHFFLCRKRASGVPVRQLKVLPQSRQRKRCKPLLDSRTVRDAAARLAVNKSTSMRWRHRFLNATKADRPASLNGIVEADETFLLESEKGARDLGRAARKRGGRASKRGISIEQVCILVARDRSGSTHDFVTGNGPVTTAQLVAYLPPILAPDTLLVTDANAAYQAFSRKTGISHAFVNLRAGVRVAEHARGAIHVQNVNGYHGRFHGWLRQFNGVATRYLSNYLGWRWAIDQQRIHSPETFLRAAIGVFHS